MTINLALLLTVLTGVTGMVTLLDSIWLRTRHAESAGASRPLATVVEYSRSFFPVLLFVLLIRSFVFEPFRIPSASMNPTLLEGDFIFVKKYSYGLRLPVVEQKFIETGAPKRGDVVVFRLPRDPSINYIKRVVGLPGDTIRYVGHSLSINGKPIDSNPSGRQFERAEIYREDLDGRVHDIAIHPGYRSRQEGTWVVPAGHYFMMGDNRDSSKDSRYADVGLIAEHFLVGKATRVWMHWVPGWNVPDWGRIGMKIE